MLTLPLPSFPNTYPLKGMTQAEEDLVWPLLESMLPAWAVGHDIANRLVKITILMPYRELTPQQCKELVYF